MRRDRRRTVRITLPAPGRPTERELLLLALDDPDLELAELRDTILGARTEHAPCDRFTSTPARDLPGACQIRVRSHRQSPTNTDLSGSLRSLAS